MNKWIRRGVCVSEGIMEIRYNVECYSLYQAFLPGNRHALRLCSCIMSALRHRLNGFVPVLS